MSFSWANMIRGHAETRPDREAIVSGDTRLTWAGLHDRSSRAANGLLEAGVRPGDRVALLMKNAAEFFEVAFGASKVGATIVALNWRLAAPEIAAIVADARPAVLVVDAEHVHLVPAGRDMVARTLGSEYEDWLAAAGADVTPVAQRLDADERWRG